MASNNWAPLPPRKNEQRKKEKMQESKIFMELKEMFGSNFDTDVIIAVAQSCNWKLESAVDALIQLSQSDESSNSKSKTYDPWEEAELPWENTENNASAQMTPDLMNFNADEEARMKQEEMFREFEKVKLREFQDTSSSRHLLDFDQEGPSGTEGTSDEHNEIGQKMETASLCGLKVQYRPGGMENQSDDDADVVIEEEEDFTANVLNEPQRVNVCEFLSGPMSQCPPKNTFPKVNYVSTPSPPCSPRHAALTEKPSTLSRLYENIDRGYKVLIILRGVPGSGKTYLARSIVSRTTGASYTNHVFSADDYFQLRGTYRYEQNNLQEAHSYCQKRAIEAMKKGVSPIIIDNTNTQAWEMQPYASPAVKYGYIVETLEPNTQWCWKARELEKRNVHGVPRSKIQKMLDRYEPKINGERLLRISRLEYNINNHPPQMRSFPPPPTQPKPIVETKSPATSSPRRRMRKPKKAETQESWLNKIAKEYADMSPENEKKIPNESWIEGSSFKEENLETKLGAIGCERKSTTKADDNTEDTALVDAAENQSTRRSNKDDRDEFTTRTVESNLLHAATEFGMKQGVAKPQDVRVNVLVDVKCHISDETPVSTENSEDQTAEAASAQPEDTSECRDYYIIMNGCKIASRLSPSTSPILYPSKGTHPVFANDGKTNYKCTLEEFLVEEKQQNKDDQEATPENLEPEVEPDVVKPIVEASPELDILEPEIKSSAKEQDSVDAVVKESSTPSDKASSEGSSFERISDVDMMQFEVYGPEHLADSPQQTTPRESNEPGESKNVAGLDYIFNFFKTPFSEIENDKKTAGQADDTDTCAPDQPSSNLRNTSPTSNDEASGLTSPLIPEVVNDIEQQNSNRLVDELEGSSRSDSVEIIAKVEKREIDNVVEQLLEASSDFQLVEQMDLTVRRTTIDEQSESTSSDVQEKTTSGQMKNFKNYEKNSETEDKVAKESINQILSGGKAVTESALQISQKSKQKYLADSESNADNLNQITWRESPFPGTSSDSPISVVSDDETRAETRDCGTYTDPYDFNVVYLGGLDGYTVIKAANRNINDPSSTMPKKEKQRQTHKLMLDKGTMTNSTSVFSTDTMLDLEDTGDNEDRSAELVKRFPDLPYYFVLDVYYDLCNSNFNWTVDYIRQFKPADLPSCKQFKEDYWFAFEKLNSAVRREEERRRKSSSESSSSAGNKTQTPKKQQEPNQQSKRKSRQNPNDEKLALKLELENKIVMTPESYSPHMLRVHRWKHGFDKFDLLKSEEPDEERSFDGESPPWIDNGPVEEDIKKNWDLPVGLNKLEADKASSSSEEEDDDDEEEEEQTEESVDEDMVELKLGDEFIRELERNFGSADFASSDGLMPVIQVPKSLAQQLHACWIESMNRQFWAMQDQLDLMIAKDAEYARSLEVEEARAVNTPEVPNLKEIMDMEMALATYTNDVKRNQRKELPKEIAKRITQDTLFSMYPDFDRKMLSEIYEAHGRDFDETVKVIEENCANKSTLTMADCLKKRKNLIDELKKESYLRDSLHNQLELTEDREESFDIADYDEDFMSYEKAMEVAQSAREEARRQFALRTENYQKAHDAHKKRNPEVAAYYSDVAKLHMKKMERANESAATAYLAAQLQTTEAEHTLDLHFLHVAEAIEALHIFIDHQLSQMSRGKKKRILIITGKGMRSINRQSKLKPAVARELNKRNIRFEEVKCNSGMLQAFLRKK